MEDITVLNSICSIWQDLSIFGAIHGGDHCPEEQYLAKIVYRVCLG